MLIEVTPFSCIWVLFNIQSLRGVLFLVLPLRHWLFIIYTLFFKWHTRTFDSSQLSTQSYELLSRRLLYTRLLLSLFLIFIYLPTYLPTFLVRNAWTPYYRFSHCIHSNLRVSVLLSFVPTILSGTFLMTFKKFKPLVVFNCLNSSRNLGFCLLTFLLVQILVISV